MRLFMFRCPRTEHVVKGQADDPRLGEPAHTYHPVQCSACKGSHLVDPTTGETWRDGIEGLLDEEEQTSRGRTMLPVIKYLWPLWIGLILQFFTNVAGEFVFGENRAFADWVFGRNCDDIACGGKIWFSMWGTVAVLTVVNAIMWGSPISSGTIVVARSNSTGRVSDE
jgi:hypothetical protein